MAITIIPADRDTRLTEAEYDALTEEICAEIAAKPGLSEGLKADHIRAQREFAKLFRGCSTKPAMQSRRAA